MPRKVFKTIYDYVSEREIPIDDYLRSGERKRAMAPHDAGFHGLPGNVSPKSEGFGAWLYDANPLPWPLTSSPSKRRERHREVVRDAWDEVMHGLFANDAMVMDGHEPAVDTVSRMLNDKGIPRDVRIANNNMVDFATRQVVAPLALQKIRAEGKRNAISKAAGAAITGGLIRAALEEDEQ